MAGSYDRSLFTYYVKLLSKQWYHFTFPPTAYECASFSTSPSTCLIISVFNFSHSNMNAMVSCGFNLYSLIINDIWHHFMCLFIIYISSMVKIHVFIFMCLFVIYLSSVVKCLFKYFANLIIFVFLLLRFESSLYSGYKSFFQVYVLKIFSPICGLSLLSINSVFWRKEVFNFEVQFKLISFFFIYR